MDDGASDDPLDATAAVVADESDRLLMAAAVLVGEVWVEEEVAEDGSSVV